METTLTHQQQQQQQQQPQQQCNELQAPNSSNRNSSSSTGSGSAAAVVLSTVGGSGDSNFTSQQSGLTHQQQQQQQPQQHQEQQEQQLVFEQNSHAAFAMLIARISGGGGGGTSLSDRRESLVSNLSNSSSGAGVGGGNNGSVTTSMASLGSLGTTANALYSSIGIAFNSLTSPITAAAAAATATTAEVVVAAASALTNHLSSPTSGTPPRNEISIEDDDDEEDCDDDDDDEENNQNDNHIASPSDKKSWSEIKVFVTNIRKELANLSSMVPSNIQFRTLSDGRVRCYFLGTPPAAWETTLYYVDININEPNIFNKEDEYMQADIASTTTTAAATISSTTLRSPTGSVGGGSGSGSSTSLTFSQQSQPILTSASIFNKINTSSQTKRLHWKPVLQQPLSGASLPSVAAGGGAWSRELQLLQERKRILTWGITSYELHKPSGKIVFPCFNDLYQCLDTGYTTSPLFPAQLRTSTQWGPIDPQICPQNSELIAYISGCDIWVTQTLSGHEKRLTFAHDGRRSVADDPLSSGMPSYVMQEEFSRYQGYWWQPHSDDGIYRIVYEEVDESDVCLYTFPSSQAIPGEIEEYRFPRTGTANAKSKLKMVQFGLDESLHISEVCIKDLRSSLSVLFPWMEYIVRVGWTPDSKYVWIQGLDRQQQRLDLILIPVDNFCETYSSSTSSPLSSTTEHSWKLPCPRNLSPIQVIFSQTSESWINVHDLLYFLEIRPTVVTFLWASEENGFRHLYLITASLNACAAVANGVGVCKKDHHSQHSTATMTMNVANEPENMCTNHHAFDGAANASQRTKSSSFIAYGLDSYASDAQMEYNDNHYLYPRILNKVALTSGEWEVLNRNLWVDREQQLVYFLGLRDTPLEKHLYVVSLQRPEHIRLLTEPGYSYVVEFDESCRYMLQVYCNIQRLPSCKLMCVRQTCQNGGVNGLQLSLLGYLNEGGKPDAQYCPKIYRPQLSSGEIVYAMVFKPHNFESGVKYPTVLNVYGGPEVQTVSNTFKGKHHLRMHMLAAQGYCVISIDSRGSRHRGLKFESHIRCKMGQVELSDQVGALRILADQLGYIDMNRIGIHGWSYGGYLSLMGLVQHPDIFKVAIAGAPVTNWEYYDTGYTERYMDLPQNNNSGYSAGSVLNYIDAFPEEENRLLLIHGLIDENVHFYHTSQLINALNKANKPYQLHIFPDERHSLRNLESNKNYETKLLSFLQNL